MGESYGRWQLGSDTELMQYIPTINVACDFHAGDPHVMWRTMEAAARAGVEVGAHVALPDILGFGRRPMVSSRARGSQASVGPCGCGCSRGEHRPGSSAEGGRRLDADHRRANYLYSR